MKKFFGHFLLHIAKPVRTLRMQWSLPAEKTHLPQKHLGRDRFFVIFRLFKYDLEWVTSQLNANFANHWVPGEDLNVGTCLNLMEMTVTDELVDPFRGRSPAQVYIPRKPHPNGHLIYEGVSLDKETNLPYLYHMLPFFGGKRPDTKDVMENMTNGEVPRTIIADSWFPSQSKLPAVTPITIHHICRECGAFGRTGMEIHYDVSKVKI